ncbi:unnamed protein product [Sphagnum troendelagicum]|uniref:Folate-biopterin transporter 4 n=1 Tax=Sphagnum troendelagicum TaxID=128251 RepID=A0ABP0THZ9_9BRYO
MKWMRRLKSSYGAPFLLLVCSVYWTQGFRSFAWTGISYQMKDELRLSPSLSQFVISVVFIPWSIKPIYGILSDCVPIGGRRRVPYLIIASILSFVPWFLLGYFEALRASYIYLMVLVTSQNFGAAMADVVVDAMVAEKARKESAEYSGDLQSLSWLAMAFGGILGSVSGGLCLAVLKVKGIFLLFSIFPLLQLVSCIFIHEKSANQMAVVNNEVLEGAQNIARDSSTADKQYDNSSHGVSTNVEGLRKRKAASPQEVISRLPKSLDGIEAPLQSQRGLFHDLQTTLQALWRAVKQPDIIQPMLWFLISQSVVPNLSTVMFYYQTNHLHMNSSFLGTSRVVGWGGLMCGTFFYNRYLKHVPLRKTFWWVHVGLTVLTLIDIILVLEFNSYLGIPNKAFVLGLSALGDAVSQFKFMPFLVLSGQLCPPGIEGTLFALFMSVNNFGSTLSSFAGGSLASVLHISSENFDNLALGIFLQAACTLVPIFFLFLIPPTATGAAHDEHQA